LDRVLTPATSPFFFFSFFFFSLNLSVILLGGAGVLVGKAGGVSNSAPPPMPFASGAWLELGNNLVGVLF
jgi:hypothetical protein